jgi:phosphomannomutase
MAKLVRLQDWIDETGVRFGTSGVRGLVEAMSDELCYAYTSSFIQHAIGYSKGLKSIVLGHDLRPSSPRIAAACAAAIRDHGLQPIYAGALPTPAIASYAAEHNMPAVIVTGSHIPFDRNGIKFYSATGEITKEDERAIEAASVAMAEVIKLEMLGLPDQSVEAHYIQRYVDFFGVNAFKGKRVAIYAHSSVARDILKLILEALGVEVLSLGRTDEFVPIDTEAVRHEDVALAKAWASKYAVDAIVSTDGDADRPLIADEHGNWLRGDVVGVLCAHYLQIAALATPVSSNTVAELSGFFSGGVIRTKIGSPFVIAAMQTGLRQGLNISGYEANGGFLLGADVTLDCKKMKALPTRDAVLPILAILALSKKMGCGLSELSNALPSRFTYSDRIQNFSAEMSAKLLADLQKDQRLIKQLMGPDLGDVIEINLIDGVRVKFASGDIVHVRPSGNAPELRCYCEAISSDQAQNLCKQCLGRLATYRGNSD